MAMTRSDVSKDGVPTMSQKGHQEKRRHHQIPRFYLQRFSCPNTGRIWTYDKEAGKAWPRSVDDTGFERHLYSVTMDDGQRNTEIEDMIAKIEETAAPLLQEVISGKDLSGQSRYDFASFVAMMLVRTNAFRRLYAEIHGNMRMARDYGIASNDALFETTMQRFQADCGEVTDEQKQRLRAIMLDPSDYIIQVDREYTLLALGFHDALAPLISSMEWTVVEAPKKDRWFLTSDNPVTQWVPPQYCHPSRGTGGFRNKHVEVLFPLSPTLCWIGHWLQGTPRYMRHTTEWVKQTNRITADSAEKFLYSHVERAGILRLAKKYSEIQPKIQMFGAGPENKAEIRVVKSSVLRPGNTAEQS